MHDDLKHEENEKIEEEAGAVAENKADNDCIDYEPIEKHISDGDDAGDDSPLLPHHHRGSRAERRREGLRMRYFALALTTAFIFISIAMIVLYFTLPSMIKRAIDGASFGDGSAHHASHSIIRADPIRLHSVEESSFQVDADLYFNLTTPLPWGSQVEVRWAEMIWRGTPISVFQSNRSLHIARGQGQFVERKYAVRVSIADAIKFGEFVNSLLLDDEATVTVIAELGIKPDYFLRLPTIKVQVRLPICGIPTLLKRNGATDIGAGSVDITEVAKQKLLLASQTKLQMPYFPIGVDVYCDHCLISTLQSRRRAGDGAGDRMQVEAIVPQFNEGLRKVMNATEEVELTVVGRPDLTLPVFRDIVGQIDAALSMPVKDAAQNAFGLVQEICLLGILGATATRCRNPFSVDIFVDRIDWLTIYRHGNGAQLGKVERSQIGQTIPAKAADFVLRSSGPSGRVRFTGGVSGALAVVRDIRRNGHVLVDLAGAVTLRIGNTYEAARVPVNLQRIRVSVSRKAIGQ